MLMHILVANIPLHILIYYQNTKYDPMVDFIMCFFLFCFQVDNDDLVSLNNPETDFETEQLISEIELLTSRALQETHQWGSGNSPKKVGATNSISLLEANNNPTSENWALANNQENVISSRLT